MPPAHATIAAIAALLISVAVRADPAPFDLAGPTIKIRVTRGTDTVSIARIPNLAPDDRVWIKAVFADDQGAHYILVAAFLRGSTEPPPAAWFSRCNTWAGKCARDGLTVTVPKEARQFLIFLAPETGGDFKTLVNAVRGRPGTFVRTSQELNQAALEHARLEAYLEAVRKLGAADPAGLKEAAPLLSRSLAIKVDEKCLDRIPVLQAPCLMQGRDSLIMADGHSASIAQELTSGPASDLAMQASNAPQLKSGYFGPFIGSLLDIARLFDGLHTAHYQYIPALASAEGEDLRLALNAAPSFHDPKSVLVVALPAVETPQLPPLRAVDPTEVYCICKEPLILPMEGAPLVFATGYARGMTLRFAANDGRIVELPARADAAHGGLAIDTSSVRDLVLHGRTRATLRGQWGFDAYDGPSVDVASAGDRDWRLAAGDELALVVGRQNTVRLLAGSAQCVQEIALQDSTGRHLQVEWKRMKPDEVDLNLSLQDATPGDLTLLVRHYGAQQSQQLALHAYAESGHVDSFALHAGDKRGILRGTRLDEIDKLSVSGVEFVPETLASSAGRDELSVLASTMPRANGFRAGEAVRADVTLKDGRTLSVETTIGAPRPSAILIGKSTQLSPSDSGGAQIRLTNDDELPQDAILTFALRAQSPASFALNEEIEIAMVNGESSTVLDFAHGAMRLQNGQVAVASLDPAKTLGSSAFGPLRFRRVIKGVAGDWQPLATLVRLPQVKTLRCVDAEPTCTLSGINLFLLDSVSADSQFEHPTSVPDGFTAETLPVPRPAERRLYVKLRDDPSVISVLSMKDQAAPARVDGRTPDPTTAGQAPSAQSPEAARATAVSAASDAEVPSAAWESSGTSSTPQRANTTESSPLPSFSELKRRGPAAPLSEPIGSGIACHQQETPPECASLK